MPNLADQQTQQHRFTLSSHLATPSAPRSNQQDNKSFDSYSSAIASRALSTVSSPSLLAQRLELVEQLSAKLPVLDARKRLRDDLDLFDESTWSDLQEERWMEELCPYPACEYLRKNKNGRPSKAYDPERAESQKAIFRIAGGSLVQAKSTIKAFEPFCSRTCKERNDFYRDLVVRRVAAAKGKDRETASRSTMKVELLEDIEVRRQRVLQAAQEESEEVTSISPSPQNETTPSPAPPLSHSFIIKENETPFRPPSPPSLASLSIDFERPTPSPRTSSTIPVGRSSPPKPGTLSIQPRLSRAPSPPPSHIQPTKELALPGLPTPRWLTGPVMVDGKTGKEEEWGEEEQMNEEEMRWMEEGLKAIGEERERLRKLQGEK